MMLSDVCRVHGPNWRTERPRKTKIGIKVAHVTRTPLSRSEGQKSQEAGAYCGGLPPTACFRCVTYRNPTDAPGNLVLYNPDQ